MGFHALLFTLVVGHVTDRTTGQPLRVQVLLSGHGARTTARTDSQGRFHLNTLRPGTYVMRLWSDDVSPIKFNVHVSGKRMTLRIPVCSTTLDYSCGGPGGGGG
jgi:hypothetical protein